MKDYRQCGTYKDRIRNHAQQKYIPFGDEGGWYAAADFEAELDRECEKCSNYRCPVLHKNEDDDNCFGGRTRW